ncbi:hypothetical protein IGJ51_000334 [Enterococcus sp. DIV0802c]
MYLTNTKNKLKQKMKYSPMNLSLRKYLMVSIKIMQHSKKLCLKNGVIRKIKLNQLPCNGMVKIM